MAELATFFSQLSWYVLLKKGFYFPPAFQPSLQKTLTSCTVVDGILVGEKCRILGVCSELCENQTSAGRREGLRNQALLHLSVAPQLWGGCILDLSHGERELSHHKAFIIPLRLEKCRFKRLQKHPFPLRFFCVLRCALHSESPTHH